MVPIREKFEDFSKDKETVAKLKKLYKTPDDVDLVVGVQLDEEYFPGTTVPKSALIISLFSLFGMGNSDRFSVGYAVTRCLLVGKPWDCKPSNALEELLWAPRPTRIHPNARWMDTFWLNELDLPAHGENLLWRLVTENTDIKCLQQRPLFPADAKTNPILCTLPKTSAKRGVESAMMSGIEVILYSYREHQTLLNTLFVLIATLLAYVAFGRWKKLADEPHVYGRWTPIFGIAIKFNKDPRAILLKGFKEYGTKVFGLRLSAMTHFVVSQPSDMNLIMADAPYEAKFNSRGLMTAVNMPLITGKENFDSNIHNILIATHLSKPETVKRLAETAMKASTRFVNTRVSPGHHDTFVPLLMDYITAVVAGTFVGPEAFDHPDLLKLFAGFNDHAMKAMGLSGLLPSFLKPLAGFSIKSDYRKVRKIVIPMIQERRKQMGPDLTFLDLILEAVEDDQRAAG